jgi:hypothetical protein
MENPRQSLPQQSLEKAAPSVHDGSRSASSSLFEAMDPKEIERLGRVRPECFKTQWAEIGFVLSICMAQILVVRIKPIFSFFIFFSLFFPFFFFSFFFLVFILSRSC